MSTNPTLHKNFTAGDRRTAVADTLVKSDGTAVDLTDHTVAFKLVRASDDTVLIDEEAATVDSPPTDGNVSYPWTTAPPNPASGKSMRCHYWWVVTRTSDGKREHFPADGETRVLWIHKNH